MIYWVGSNQFLIRNKSLNVGKLSIIIDCFNSMFVLDKFSIKLRGKIYIFYLKLNLL